MHPYKMIWEFIQNVKISGLQTAGHACMQMLLSTQPPLHRLMRHNIRCYNCRLLLKQFFHFLVRSLVWQNRGDALPLMFFIYKEVEPIFFTYNWMWLSLYKHFKLDVINCKILDPHYHLNTAVRNGKLRSLTLLQSGTFIYFLDTINCVILSN